MQHAIKRVKRPGESQALDGKKPPGGIGVSGVDPVQGMNLSQVQSLRSAGDVLQARHGFVPERLGDVSTGQGGTGVFVPDTEAGVCRCPEGSTKGGAEIIGMFSLRVRNGLGARSVFREMGFT